MLAPALAKAIEERLKRLGDYGSLTIVVKRGSVAEYETRITERTEAVT